MAPAGIVLAFDEPEDRHAGLGLGLELAPIEQFAFQGRGEGLGFIVTRIERTDQNRIASVLERLGWRRSAQRGSKGERYWCTAAG